MPIKIPVGMKIQLKNTAEMNPNRSLLIIAPTKVAELTVSGRNEPLYRRLPSKISGQVSDN